MSITDIDRDKIKHAMNTDIVRRLLIKYFIGKGFTESFDRSINPILTQDLSMAIPGLEAKLEIIPHAKNIDPTTGQGVLGWNLFVLGNQRMYIGETYHHNLTELARQIRTGQVLEGATAMTRRETTPRRLISFITRVLENNEAGFIDFSAPIKPMRTRPIHYRPIRGPSQEAMYYSRSGYGA